MFVKSLKISNFRVFNVEEPFELSDLNMPDSSTPGKGLNIFVGENGCGKTTLLDALSVPLLGYKAETVKLKDFNDTKSDIHIEILSDKDFKFDGTMPKVSYKGKGFEFEAKIRSRGNSAYLSSTVVFDQRFIRADGQTKPADGSPDLRLKVDNPWKGSRFSENDFLYLDKNRLFQSRSGTYNQTRFDRLMEDQDYRYVKTNPEPKDYDKALRTKLAIDNNEYLDKALTKFKSLYGEEISLNLLDNYQPHKTGFFAAKKSDNQQVQLSDIGSGYEMIFTFLYSYYLSKQSGKQMILLIDEPELHLHPKLQESFAELLIEFSKDAQIFITSHSPLLVKQLLTNISVDVHVLVKDGSKISKAPLKDRKLSFLSANEVNFIAFNLATEEYHNELYEELKNAHGANLKIKPFDIAYFQNTKNETANYEWMGTANQVSLHTFVRNQIHHRADCGTAKNSDIQKSIEFMRSCF